MTIVIFQVLAETDVELATTIALLSRGEEKGRQQEAEEEQEAR